MNAKPAAPTAGFALFVAAVSSSGLPTPSSRPCQLACNENARSPPLGSLRNKYERNLALLAPEEEQALAEEGMNDWSTLVSRDTW